MKPRYYLLVALYCVFLFSLSAQQHPPDVGPSFSGKDKLAHTFLYGGLATLVAIGLRRSNPAVPARILYVIPFAFTFLFGFTDELHQYFVPNRHCDVLDLVADSLGAALAVGFWCAWRWRVPLSEIFGRQETLEGENG